MTKDEFIQGLQRSLTRALHITQLKGEVIEETAGDPEAFRWGLGFVAVVALMTVLPVVGSLPLPALIAFLGIPFLVFFLCCLILHLVATRLFGGDGEYMDLARVSGFLGPLHWLRAIPFAGLLATVWSLVVEVVIVERVYRVTREKAVLATVVSVVVSGVVTFAAYRLVLLPLVMSPASMTESSYSRSLEVPSPPAAEPLPRVDEPRSLAEDRPAAKPSLDEPEPLFPPSEAEPPQAEGEAVGPKTEEPPQEP